MTEDDAPQTAMMLTDQEWDDLAHMVGHFRNCTSWTTNETQRLEVSQDHLADLDRRRSLAQRIIEAAL